MFYYKQIKELQKKVDEMESQVIDLTTKVLEQSNEIDKLYALFVNLTTNNGQKQKPKPKYRPRKKNGKENTEATE